ncbi:hypothetical protein C4588_05550 [Candidatus Parcubacteria bacterium]|nr:MAG: hypothetical protein C4588_05550 [Candidatus Parcubacteria bacterium]
MNFEKIKKGYNKQSPHYGGGSVWPLPGFWHWQVFYNQNLSNFDYRRNPEKNQDCKHLRYSQAKSLLPKRQIYSDLKGDKKNDCNNRKKYKYRRCYK